MGIKGLNRFLKATCYNNIYHISLEDLRGKTIVVDASIYMYRFKCDDKLIEGVYQMLSQFKYFNIVPIFVFDGKPPPEKYDVLQQRRLLKREAEHRYYELKDQLETDTTKYEMDTLRKKFVRISKDDVEKVKKLLELMGTSYYECEGESDAVCAYFVKTGRAYACLSEDMDLFVYGTLMVLRYLSLLKSTVVVYDTLGVLTTLKLTFKEFQSICLLSGCDYNNGINDFDYSLNMFIKYQETDNENTYSDWMIKKDQLVGECSFDRAIEMFDISKLTIDPTRFIKSTENNEHLKEFLSNYGFIFVNNQ